MSEDITFESNNSNNNHIINGIFKKMYYDKLFKNDQINKKIINLIESGKANLDDSVIEYLYSHNKTLIENIQVLNANTNNITQKSIDKFTNLKILIAKNNKNIKNINHLANTLIKLDVSGYMCGIDQNGINNLTILQTLNAEDNMKITSANHLADTLIELDASSCGIDQKGISELKILKKIDTTCNQKITNLNHLKYTLETLQIGSHPQCGPSGINDDGIADLQVLKYVGGYHISAINFPCDAKYDTEGICPIVI